jgi:hypothetical protein
MAGSVTLRADGRPLTPERSFSLRWIWRWRSVAGQVLELDRLVSVARSDSLAEDPAPVATDALARSRALGWRGVLAAHETAWRQRWAAGPTDKIMVIVPPIAAFVAAGFEHSIANLYFLPYGLAIKAWATPEFWATIGQDVTTYSELTVSGALHNIVVATIGNLVGGSLLVGAVYWFVYLRRPA